MFGELHGRLGVDPAALDQDRRRLDPAAAAAASSPARARSEPSRGRLISIGVGAEGRAHWLPLVRPPARPSNLLPNRLSDCLPPPPPSSLSEAYNLMRLFIWRSRELQQVSQPAIPTRRANILGLPPCESSITMELARKGQEPVLGGPAGLSGLNGRRRHSGSRRAAWRRLTQRRRELARSMAAGAISCPPSLAGGSWGLGLGLGLGCARMRTAPSSHPAGKLGRQLPGRTR